MSAACSLGCGSRISPAFAPRSSRRWQSNAFVGWPAAIILPLAPSKLAKGTTDELSRLQGFAAMSEHNRRDGSVDLDRFAHGVTRPRIVATDKTSISGQLNFCEHKPTKKHPPRR